MFVIAATKTLPNGRFRTALFEPCVFPQRVVTTPTSVRHIDYSEGYVIVAEAFGTSEYESVAGCLLEKPDAVIYASGIRPPGISIIRNSSDRPIYELGLPLFHWMFDSESQRSIDNGFHCVCSLTYATSVGSDGMAFLSKDIFLKWWWSDESLRSLGNVEGRCYFGRSLFDAQVSS